MLKGVGCSDSFFGVHLKTRFDEVLKCLVSLTPVHIPERDRAGAIFVILHCSGFVGRRQLVEQDAEAPHVYGRVDETPFADLWRHVAECADLGHRDVALAVHLLGESEVAQFHQGVLFGDLSGLLEHVFELHISVDDAFTVDVLEAGQDVLGVGDKLLVGADWGVIL